MKTEIIYFDKKETGPAKELRGVGGVGKRESKGNIFYAENIYEFLEAIKEEVLIPTLGELYFYFGDGKNEKSFFVESILSLDEEDEGEYKLNDSNDFVADGLSIVLRDKNDKELNSNYLQISHKKMQTFESAKKYIESFLSELQPKKEKEVWEMTFEEFKKEITSNKTKNVATYYFRDKIVYQHKSTYVDLSNDRINLRNVKLYHIDKIAQAIKDFKNVPQFVIDSYLSKKQDNNEIYFAIRKKEEQQKVFIQASNLLQQYKNDSEGLAGLGANDYLVDLENYRGKTYFTQNTTLSNKIYEFVWTRTSLMFDKKDDEYNKIRLAQQNGFEIKKYKTAKYATIYILENSKGQAITKKGFEFMDSWLFTDKLLPQKKEKKQKEIWELSTKDFYNQYPLVVYTYSTNGKGKTRVKNYNDNDYYLDNYGNGNYFVTIEYGNYKDFVFFNLAQFKNQYDKEKGTYAGSVIKHYLYSKFRLMYFYQGAKKGYIFPAQVLAEYPELIEFKATNLLQQYKSDSEGLAGLGAKSNKQEVLSREAMRVLEVATIKNDEISLNSGVIERKVYEEIKETFDRLGGKWKTKGKKTEGVPNGVFVFAENNALPLLNAVLESGLMPENNPSAYFPTPEKVVKEMIEIAGYYMDFSDLQILEPSAGTGGIAEIVRERNPEATIDLVEFSPFNAKVLRNKGFENVFEMDFLEFKPKKEYDIVFMNPPFALVGDATAWITHIKHAYSMLKSDGMLVAITPEFMHKTDSKTVAFKQFMACYGGSIEGNIPQKTFADTAIATNILLFDRQNKKDKTEKYNGFPHFDIWHFIVVAENNDMNNFEKLRNIYKKAANELWATKKLREEVKKWIESSITLFSKTNILFCLDNADIEVLIQNYVDDFQDYLKDQLKDSELGYILSSATDLLADYKNDSQGLQGTQTPQGLKAGLPPALAGVQNISFTAYITAANPRQDKQGRGKLLVQAQKERVKALEISNIALLKKSEKHFAELAEFNQKAIGDDLMNKKSKSNAAILKYIDFSLIGYWAGQPEPSVEINCIAKTKSAFWHTIIDLTNFAQKHSQDAFIVSVPLTKTERTAIEKDEILINTQTADGFWYSPVFNLPFADLSTKEQLSIEAEFYKTFGEVGFSMYIYKSKINNRTVNYKLIFSHEIAKNIGEFQEIIKQSVKKIIATNYPLGVSKGFKENINRIVGLLEGDGQIVSFEKVMFFSADSFEGDSRSYSKVLAEIGKRMKGLQGLGDIVWEQRRAADSYCDDLNRCFERQKPLTNIVKGRKTDVQFTFDKDVSCQYVIVSANDLQPSHLAANQNPKFFLPEAQPRNRSMSESGGKTPEIITRNLRPATITEGATAYAGASVVNTRGEVIQGNGRAYAMKLYWDFYPNDDKAYSDFVYYNPTFQFEKDYDYSYNKNSSTAIFTHKKTKQVTKIEFPILVRMIDISDKEAIKLGQYGQSDLEATTSATQTVKSKGNLISKTSYKIIVEELLLRDNGDNTLNELIRNSKILSVLVAEKVITTNDLEKYINKQTGEINEAGTEFVAKLLLQTLFSDGDVNLPEIFANLPYNIQKGIEKGLLYLLKVPASKNLTVELSKAIMALREFLQAGTPFLTWINQISMTGGRVTDRYSRDELRLTEFLSETKTQTEIATKLKMYATLSTPQPATMFSAASEAKPKQEAFDMVFRAAKTKGKISPSLKKKIDLAVGKAEKLIAKYKTIKVKKVLESSKAIDADNYKSVFKTLNFAILPKAILEGHRLFLTSYDLRNYDIKIKQFIDLHLFKVNQALTVVDSKEFEKDKNNVPLQVAKHLLAKYEQDKQGLAGMVEVKPNNKVLAKLLSEYDYKGNEFEAEKEQKTIKTKKASFSLYRAGRRGQDGKIYKYVYFYYLFDNTQGGTVRSLKVWVDKRTKEPLKNAYCLLVEINKDDVYSIAFFSHDIYVIHQIIKDNDLEVGEGYRILNGEVSELLLDNINMIYPKDHIGVDLEIYLKNFNSQYPNLQELNLQVKTLLEKYKNDGEGLV